MKFKIPYKEFLVVLTTCILFLVIGEIFLRIYLGSRIIYDIEMTRYSNLVKKDSDNPRIGHVHKPNVNTRLMGADFRTNSDGFRDREYPIAKGKRYRIIFLGDSLTLGWGVRQEKAFENILETNLDRIYPVEIINFGTGNYNTEQEVNLFFEKGLKYNPDKVVLFYFINDAETTPKKSKLWFLGYSRIITFYWSRFHGFANNIFSSQSFQEYYADLYKEDREGWQRAKLAFLELITVCEKNGIELQVVLLPELHNPKDFIFKKENESVSSFLEENGVDHIDLAPFFAEYNGDPMKLWVARDDAHPNDEAHALIAKYALDFIRKRKGENGK